MKQFIVFFPTCAVVNSQGLGVAYSSVFSVISASVEEIVANSNSNNPDYKILGIRDVKPRDMILDQETGDMYIITPEFTVEKVSKLMKEVETIDIEAIVLN